MKKFFSEYFTGLFPMSIVGFLGLVASLVFPQWSYLFGVLIGIWLVHFDRHLTKRAGDNGNESED